MSDFNSSLPVRTESAGDVIVKLGDGTTPSQQLAIDSSGRVVVKLDDGAGNLITSQANGAQRALDVGINVGGVQVDPREIRALTSTDVVIANIKDGTGTAFSSTNPLPVSFSSAPLGTAVDNYQTNAAVAAAATSNHDYTVTALKTLILKQIEASASGKSKIEIQIESGLATNTFATIAVMFNSTSYSNMSMHFEDPKQVVAGVRVRVIRSNLDKQAQDLYSTIMGQEV